MDRADLFRLEMEKLTLCGGSLVAIAEDAPLAALAETVERAHALGPIVDPTQYRAAVADGRLDKQAAMLRALRTFVRAWREAGLPVPGDPPAAVR